jgi:mono/diheme cytochrome c family protein
MALVAAEPKTNPSVPGKSAGAPSGVAAEKVKRGEYLTTVIGCNDCHTPGTLYGAPDFTRTLSGSELGWRGPWGVTFAANITPDPETGIGKWSEAEIVNCIRTGQRPDGRVLLPPMPYQDFAHLSDADAYAIAAFLKSIPAVKHMNLGPVAPGHAVTGSIIDFPPPSMWDVPHSSTESPPSKP